MTINHSLKFFSGPSSEESCMDNVKRKLYLTANTGLGLGEFDKEDLCVRQRIWCGVTSNEVMKSSMGFKLFISGFVPLTKLHLSLLVRNVT